MIWQDRRAIMGSAFPSPSGEGRSVVKTVGVKALAEPGACGRPQRPPLGCGPSGLPDRRLRAAGTRVGGLPLPRPGVLVPSETSRSGVRSSRGRGASGSARTCAIQPSRGVRDCMAETKHQTAYRTVKGAGWPALEHRAGHPDASGPLRVPAAQKVCSPGLGTHKKTGLGQARDRRTHFVSFNFANSLICAATSSFAIRHPFSIGTESNARRNCRAYRRGAPQSPPLVNYRKKSK